MSGESFDFSSGSDDIFDESGRARSLAVVATPPLPLLGAAMGTALVGALAAWLVPGIVPRVIGWVLAGPVAFGVLALFINRDTAARATGLYTAPAWLTVGYRAAAALSMVAVLLCAVRIADWVGRL